MSWSSILGHEQRVDAFRQIVARHRLAHAYLFVGPDGIGKRRFALELAKALLCEAPKTPRTLDACDQCDACHLVTAGTHPDLFQLAMPEGKNEFPVEIMREFYKDFSMKAARGAHKVGIIDDSDLFHPAAANSFLKTLEEPPPGSLLILLSSNLDLQLETIKSRCHIVRFAPLSDAHVRQLLEQRPEVDAKLLDRLVRLAGGSPGQALELADENLWTCRRVLLHGLAQPKVDSFGLALKFVECAGEAGKETAPQRRRAGQMLRLLIEAFSDVMRLQAGATARSAEPAELPLLNALAERARPEKINAAIERCLETETQLDRYVQISLVLEGLMDALGQVLEHPGVLPARYQGFNV